MIRKRIKFLLRKTIERRQILRRDIINSLDALTTLQFIPASELASQLIDNINTFINGLPRMRTRVQFAVAASQLVLHMLSGIFEEMSEPENNYHPIIENEILQALDLVIEELVQVNLINETAALGYTLIHMFILILIV